MVALTLLKVGLLLLIVFWGFGSGLGDWANFAPFAERKAGADPIVPALAGASVAGFFSFAGWWDLAKLAGEVRSPARTLPRALLLGLLIVTVLYVLTSAAFLYLVPAEQVPTGETAGQAFAAQVGQVLFGRTGRQVFSGIVAGSLLGSIAAYIMAAPRVYYAMARDGLFIKQVAAVHRALRHAGSRHRVAGRARILARPRRGRSNRSSPTSSSSPWPSSRWRSRPSSSCGASAGG